MDIEGTYTLQAAPEEVWNSLMDFQTLRQTISGLERLEALGNNTFAFTLHIKHAPLRGTYTGQVQVDDLHYPSSFRMTVDGESQQSNIQGVWDIHLTPHDQNTVISYQGVLNLGKLSGLIPAPLLKGTLKVLIQQFFTSLAEQLRTTSRVYLSSTEENNGLVVENIAHNGQSVDVGGKPTPLHTLVHTLKLGDSDPLLEEQWVSRLRRFGTISILLLLVWVGTRIPRRLFSQD
ncbi:MAG TPA: carbon monoxide dehydrogenase subunit G [Ktedonobacteraceae bacterium]|jgi:carbon monoxide dehydrogenase subunit G|nr:carbon monoxide dehydrogenase subunit G [Ktedonobacteraceae bacterium]